MAVARKHLYQSKTKRVGVMLKANQRSLSVGIIPSGLVMLKVVQGNTLGRVIANCIIIESEDVALLMWAGPVFMAPLKNGFGDTLIKGMIIHVGNGMAVNVKMGMVTLDLKQRKGHTGIHIFLILEIFLKENRFYINAIIHLVLIQTT